MRGLLSIVAFLSGCALAGGHAAHVEIFEPELGMSRQQVDARIGSTFQREQFLSGTAPTIAFYNDYVVLYNFVDIVVGVNRRTAETLPQVMAIPD